MRAQPNKGGIYINCKVKESSINWGRRPPARAICKNNNKEDRVSLTTRFVRRHSSETDLFRRDHMETGIVQRANRPIGVEDPSKVGGDHYRAKDW